MYIVKLPTDQGYEPTLDALANKQFSKRKLVSETKQINAKVADKNKVKLAKIPKKKDDKKKAIVKTTTANSTNGGPTSSSSSAATVPASAAGPITSEAYSNSTTTDINDIDDSIFDSSSDSSDSGH